MQVVIVLVHKTLDHCEYHFLLGLLLPQPLAGCHRWHRVGLIFQGRRYAAAAAWAGMRVCRRLAGIGAAGTCGIVAGLRHGEQLACSRDVVGAGGVGEQAIVADAVE
jgi:hypothetical protein